MIFLLTFLALLLLLGVFTLWMESRSPLDRERKKCRPGIELFKNRQYEDAFAYFDALIGKNGKACIPCLYRGKCHSKRGNPNSALFDFTEALSLNHRFTEALLERGKVYFAMNKIEKAHQDFDKAFLYSSGRDPEVLRYRGLTFLKKHLYFQAAKDLRRAAELGDEDACHQLMQPPFHGFWMNSTFKA